ncbi:MAG: acireductone synthase [Vicinamibacteria bacterium]
MGGSLSYQGIRAVLLDIEGTTTPVDFVHQVLFPYARANMKFFLEKHPASASGELELLRTEYEQDRARGLEPPRWEPIGPVSYVHWLMDQDRKSTGLKSLQGKIWELGYRSGELRGEVYPDVPVAFERWRKQEMRICIYSSGSVLAQKLLFAHSTAGDLTRFLDAYFDTSTGGKREKESYNKIAAALSLAPSTFLFLSDVAAELDAAFEAGMKTCLCRRDGTDEPERTDHPIVRTLLAVAT